MHCDWFILLLLLPTPTIWFSLDRKGRSRKGSQKKMETFNSHWFFRVLFRRVYDYDFHNVISALKTPLAVPTPCSRLNLIVTASCPLTYLFNLWTIISKSFILCVFLKALLIVFIALETSFGHTLQHIYFWTVNHFISFYGETLLMWSLCFSIWSR